MTIAVPRPTKRASSAGTSAISTSPATSDGSRSIVSSSVVTRAIVQAQSESPIE